MILCFYLNLCYTVQKKTKDKVPVLAVLVLQLNFLVRFAGFLPVVLELFGFPLFRVVLVLVQLFDILHVLLPVVEFQFLFLV